MIEEIIAALHANFPNMRIYDEVVEQGMKAPCFLISHLSGNGKREITNRLKVDNQFMIQYFPIPYKTSKPHTEQEQCRDMLRAIVPILADLKSYHATILNGKILDNVLHFECAYSEITISVDDIEIMNDYKQNIKEKKGE